MSINITERHVNVTDAVRDHIHAKLDGFFQEYPQIEHIHVILDAQKFRKIVEVVIQAKNHVRIEAKEDTDDIIKSIDNVVDKADRQLRRSRERAVDHKISGHRTKLSDFEQELGTNP